MSGKAKFQEILTLIRTDLKYLLSLDSILRNNLAFISLHPLERATQVSKLREWIFDVFLDKAYEIDAKVKKFLVDLGYPKENINSKLSMQLVKNYAQTIALHDVGLKLKFDDPHLQGLYNAIKEYEEIFEMKMSEIREDMYNTNWSKMKQIRYEEYILPIKRARYVTARDELEKAKDAVKDGSWEEIMNHLRPAIDLALKEKFRFKRIKGYKKFFDDAGKYGLHLPSYDMVYRYFDEASQRLHEGRVHTPWECRKALNFVAEFIDRLDLVDISEKEIEEFRKRSKAVE